MQFWWPPTVFRNHQKNTKKTSKGFRKCNQNTSLYKIITNVSSIIWRPLFHMHIPHIMSSCVKMSLYVLSRSCVHVWPQCKLCENVIVSSGFVCPFQSRSYDALEWNVSKNHMSCPSIKWLQLNVELSFPCIGLCHFSQFLMIMKQNNWLERNLVWYFCAKILCDLFGIDICCAHMKHLQTV